MRFLLNVFQSLEAIRNNLFRAGITIFIIALGITALIGVLTTIEGVKSSMSTNFSSMGANTFRIRNFNSQIRINGRGRRRQKRFPQITYRQAVKFKQDTEGLMVASVSGSGGGTHVVSFQNRKTNGNVQLSGADENYLVAIRTPIASGRSINLDDVTLARNVVVIGHEIKNKLFPTEPAIGKVVNVSGNIYKVIGVFDRVGSSGSSGADESCVIPISTLRNDRPQTGSLTLNVYVADPVRMDYLMEEARGVFRNIRGLRLTAEDDFSVSRSDAFVEQLMSNLKVLTVSAQVIALITLLGASVALLNVMLVSVTERTNEIGLRKALGATQMNILIQFLMEAVVICQVGGLFGIMLGLPIGNLLGVLVMKGSFVVPWLWIIIGLIVCLVVGVGSGFYPAWKAAKVDPIESLRHV